MAKNVLKMVKIQLEAGKATPAPPVGTIFGPLGINLSDFCSKYNEATRDRMGEVIPAEVTVYEDKSFDFVLKTPPTASLLLKAANLSKGSSKGANGVVAVLSQDDIKKIAEIKMPDLNVYDIDAAIKIVSGTARNMGIAIKGVNDAELAEQAEEAKEAEAKAQALEEEFNAIEEEAKELAEASVEVEASEQTTEEETTEE